MNPAYSPEARLAELEGTVTIAATVTANGSVTDLRVVKPLGLGLDKAAKAAAAHWSFEPGTSQDGPAPMLAMMGIHFLIPSKNPVGICFERTSALPKECHVLVL